MGNKLSISIITPTFNRADEIDFLLRSISKQTYPLKNIEFIVSDDGSHDNTEKVVNKWQEKSLFNLIYIKQKNKALSNGNYGGEPINISQESEDALVIYRTKDEHELVLVFNLSQESIDVKLNEISSNELFYSLFSGQNEGQKLPDQIQLKAWEYYIYSNIK